MVVQSRSIQAWPRSKSGWTDCLLWTACQRTGSQMLQAGLLPRRPRQRNPSRIATGGWGPHVSGAGLCLLDDFEAKPGHSPGLQLAPVLARKILGLDIEPRPAAMFAVTFMAASPRPIFARRMT